VKRTKIKVLREVYETPAWAEEYLTQVGGLNRFGAPNLRVVWSNSRLGFVGGKFEERDEEGALIREKFALNFMPKYPIEDRWLIEQWIAPEKFGTPTSWFAQTKEYLEEGNIPQLGPYPSRGEYQVSCVLETTDGQFLQLQRWILEDFWKQFRAKRELTYLAGLMLEKQALETKKQKQKESDAEWAKEEMRSSVFMHDTRKKSVNDYL
jgi:hypothetical protein